jgi:hypothetical protein
VGPRAGLEAVEDRKVLKLPGIELRPSCPYPFAILTELSLIIKWPIIVEIINLSA